MEIISKLFTTPGPGGIIAMVVIGGATIFYVWLTRWIVKE